MPNEVQHLLPSVSPTLFEDGAIEISFDGQTTASIPFSDINSTATFASAIQAALEALSNIGSGNVSVAWSTDRAVVTFQGTLANTNVAEMTVSANTLKAKADTVSVTTTQNGSAGDEVTIGGDFTDGNDVDTPAVQTVTFTPTPVSGSWVFNSGTVNYPDEPSRGSGWTTSGSYAAGFTFTADSVASGQISAGASNSSLAGAGQAQIVTVTLPDSPTEGTLNVTLDATTSSDFNYNDASPASITGWTGGGSAANWTYTRDTNASNVSASGAEGSTPLRKACAIEIVTTQEGSAGGATYTLDAATGTFTLTGNATGLTVGRVIAATVGAFTLTGIDAALTRGFLLDCTAGAFALTGNDTALTAGRVLDCSAGSFALTGNDAAIAKAFVLACSAGDFALTGNDTGLTASRLLGCTAGTFALTGNDTGLTIARLLGCDAGAYTLTGNDAGLTASRLLDCSAGSFGLTGNDAALTCGRLLACSAGTFGLTGNDAALLLSRVISAAVGEFTLTGVDVTFTASLRLPWGPSAVFVLHGTDTTPVAAYGPDSRPLALLGPDTEPVGLGIENGVHILRRLDNGVV